MPTNDEAREEYEGREVTITTIGAIPMWMSWIPVCCIPIQIAFACGSLRNTPNVVERL